MKDEGNIMSREILNSFYIDAPASVITDALMQERHIQNWWTKETRIKNGIGIFGWSSFGWEVELKMSLSDITGPVVWKCIRSNMQNTNAWEGSTITFVLSPHGTGTQVDFSHTGYHESPCYEACTKGWAFFVGVSLKQYIETGRGCPYPSVFDASNPCHAQFAQNL